MAAERRRHRGERGLTLIELIVSIAILAVIGTVVAAAFSVGLKAVSAHGATDRLAGAHDLMALEQQLGQDGARASCIEVGGHVYGRTATTCAPSTGYGRVSACTSAVLCIAWPQLSDFACQVAAYTETGTDPKVIVSRTLYSVASGAANALAAVTVPLTVDPVRITLGTPDAPTAPGGYAWIRSLPITIEATGVNLGQFSQTLALHPVATDPDGAAAGITGQGSPC